MRTALLIVSLLASATVATAAEASTLVLYDMPIEQGRRLSGLPYPQQRIDAMLRAGLLRPVTVPVDDDGGRRTTVVDIVPPSPAPDFGPGFKVLQTRASWQITTERIGDQVSYEIAITSGQAFVGGGDVVQPVSSSANLIGIAPVAAQGAAFERTYSTPAGTRMMIGFVTD